LAEKFEAVYGSDDFDLTPRYNIAPTQNVPVIRKMDSGRVISSMRWGWIPSWTKHVLAAHINIRSETLLNSPNFESVASQRCLIPADGFYEWKSVGSSKYPFHFGMRDESLFVFAGIWDTWQSPEGKLVEFCAILTTTPNELLAGVHDRMPVILPPNHYQAWLSAPAMKSNHFAHMLAPYACEAMNKYPVSSLVNDVKNDRPECAIEVPEFLSPQMALF
jgi:putative SOS response-associated peptidase YedK